MDEGPSLSYERDVRPILKTHCFHCHGEGQQLEGGLDVRLRRFLVQGGESGAAIVPGSADESLLVERLRGGDMPPEDVQVRPTEAEVALIVRWVEQGAATLRDEPERLDSGWYVTEEERRYWAFQPVVRPPLPEVQHQDQVESPIDRFLLAGLESRGLGYSAPADRRTLIRRASLDLLGLPPTPEEVDRFLADPHPDAYPRLLDRLLDSPRYGERWGRHWLDVAGYADSEGGTDEDPPRPDAYKYRDYVIGSLNRDKPLDQFLVEQLAGDELVPPPHDNLRPEQVEKLVATGFLRMAPDGTGSGGVEQPVARNQVLADTLEIVSTSLLGLTVGCAQCHNHRYDPISQADYYRLRAIFEPALNCKDWKPPQARRVSLYTDADRRQAAEVERQAKEVERQRAERQEALIEQVFERELAKLPEELRETVRQARDTPAAKRTAEQQELLKKHPSVNVTASSLYLYDKRAADELKGLADQAAKIRQTKPREEFVRALVEPAGKTPPQTFVFFRGDIEQPKDVVQPGELSVLSDVAARLPDNDPSLPTTGRRLAYARWLTSGRHPLTARVLVNRVWRHHFGRGIVATPGDFGTLGVQPTHPELLDWLADELVRGGWSLKRLHRLIMTSRAYRQASARTPELDAVDADNQLLGRMPVRRLEAEVVRDMMLSLSGQLNSRMGGLPVPVMADRVGQWVLGIENLNAGRPGPVIPLKGEEFRRSVYTQVRRSRPLSVLDTFDAPMMEPNCTNRSASTVAPQSLMLMNGEQVIELAGHFARRVAEDAGDDRETRVERAWQLALGRPPSGEERRRTLEFLEAQSEIFRPRDAAADPANGAAPGAAKPAAGGQDAGGQDAGGNSAGGAASGSRQAEAEALAALCHVLISTNEFLYVD